MKSRKDFSGVGRVTHRRPRCGQAGSVERLGANSNKDPLLAKKN
jgi:hypothetical protein